MPRYEIRNTSNSALTYAEGATPLDLKLSQAAGTYRARAMSDEEATDIVVPAFAPAIAEASLTVGDTATLNLNIPGDSYQWKLDGSNISGATSATYVTAAAGSLTCLVTPQGPQSAVETAAVTVAAASSGVAFLTESAVISIDLTNVTTGSSSAIAPTAGSNRGAFLVVASEKATNTPVISAEWGAGNAFELVGEIIPATSARMIIAVFLMREANLPSGAEVITVNSTEPVTRLVVDLIEYESVHQVTSPGVLYSNHFSSGGDISITGTMTSANGLFFAVSVWRDAGATPVTVTAGAGSTTPVKRVDRSRAFRNTVAVSDELPGATGSVTHVHTSSLAANRSGLAIEVFPAA